MGLLLTTLSHQSAYAEDTEVQKTKSTVINDARQLLRDKEYQAAWQVVMAGSQDWLGEPDFDLVYGVVAMATENYHYAVFAFERLVANQSKNVAARLHLAKAYVAIKNYTGVLKQTEFLSQTQVINPAYDNIVQRLENIALNALNKQNLLIRQQVNLALGYDSNVNAGTTEDTIFIPRINSYVELFEDSLKSPDEFVSAFYGLSLKKPINQTSRWQFNLAGQGNHYQELDQFNFINLNINGSYKQDFNWFGEALAVEVGVRTMPLWLGGEFYRAQHAVFTALEHKYSQVASFTIRGSYGVTNNATNALLDSTNTQMSVHYKVLVGEFFHDVSMTLRDEDNQESTSSGRFMTSANYTAHYTGFDKWLLIAGVGYQHSEYDAEHPIFISVRDEQLRTASMVAKYQYNSKLSFGVNAKVQDKSSNIELFSYNRAELSVGTSYAF